jgi:hypothetical protein
MMQELLGKMPKLQEDKRLVVSARLCHAPRKMVYHVSLIQPV